MNKQILSLYIKDTFQGKVVPSDEKKVEDIQPRILDEIIKYTDFLPPSASFAERCYVLENDIEERPVCSCGKLLKFKSYNSGYGIKCSVSCKG